MGFSFTENYVSNSPGSSSGVNSVFDFNTLYNENNISDVSWEYIVSGLANNEALIEDKKNYFARSKKKDPSKLENNGKRIYMGNYTYTNIDDDIENEIEEEDQVSDITEMQKEQLKNAAPALDYVELFADLTKWLEYDVLITNYRGVLALPNGQMLSSGWESAIFG